MIKSQGLPGGAQDWVSVFIVSPKQVALAFCLHVLVWFPLSEHVDHSWH